MRHLYDSRAAYVGYLDDKEMWIYTSAGIPLGFIYRGSVYSPGGEPLGSVRDGCICDQRGAPAIFFAKNTSSPSPLSQFPGIKFFSQPVVASIEPTADAQPE